jgi:hypothetical protein
VLSRWKAKKSSERKSWNCGFGDYGMGNAPSCWKQPTWHVCIYSI